MTSPSPSPVAAGTSYDVAVVGAGSAGLQAALTLGRMRREVIAFGTDRYRNDPAHHMQNFIGHDGVPPAELRVAARRDLDEYKTVHQVEAEVVRISGAADAFTLEVADGTTVAARRIVLATGVTDSLPAVPGLDELFGDVVAHCPYCHGYEFRDTPVAILGSHGHLPMLAAMVERLSSTTTVLTDGAALDADSLAHLERMGIEVVTDPIAGLCRSSLGLTVEHRDGVRREFGGMFVATDWRQSAPFADQLGLSMSPVGGVLVDAFGRTSLPGVYAAAGDLAHTPDLPMPLASVLTAAAGLTAGAGVDRELAFADAGIPSPM